MFANQIRARKRLAALSILIGLSSFAVAFFVLPADVSAKQIHLDGGNSPGTYEPDPDNQRRPDDHGGPYNEPGSDDDRRGGGNSDHGGPYNEPGSDAGPY